MFNLSLENGSSVTTMLIVAGAAVLLCGTFYYRVFGNLRGRHWRALLALRTAAIVLVVLLLFRPVLSYQRELRQHKALIFLVDRSASMSIADDATGVTRFNQARQRVTKWWEQLKGDFRLHVIQFAERAGELDEVEQLAELSPDGQATSLSRGLLAAQRQFAPIEVEAVVLLSDGVHNSAGNPLETAAKLGLVVHTVGVGASLRSDSTYRDIQVVGVGCPDRLLLNNMAKITASVEGAGLAGRVATVVLQEDDQSVAETELTLDGMEGAQEASFDFRPTKKGRHRYTVRVAPVAEERIAENNHRSAMAMVVEPGIRVLYLEGTLRSEYGALTQRFLAKDPDLEFCALVQTRPNVFVRRTNIEGLQLEAIPNDAETINKFDVFLVGDLDASYFKPAQQEMIVKRVREGAGLVMLGGYHSLGPGGYAGTPLGEILPVRLGNREIGQITEPLLPRLTPEGARHPIFANIADLFPTEQGAAKSEGLPPLEGCTRVEAAKPGATVLANFGAEQGPVPVLVVQPVDKGRSAVFCGDTTRVWQQGPHAMDQKSPFLQFWGQMVRWLAGRGGAVETAANLTANTDRAYYEPDEPILISAVARDAKGEGATGARVSAKIRGPGGRSEQVDLPGAGTGGHYGGKFEPRVGGSYEISVEARVGEVNLTAETMAVEVGRPNLEFDRLDLNEKLLSQIAGATRGRYVHITTADYLTEQLNRDLQTKREFLETRLYWAPGFWLLFVGVLTAEWILRRKYQLR